MPSAFPSRHRTATPRMRAIGINNQTLAVAKQLETGNQFAQFVMLQQEARVLWMADFGLVDKKSFYEQYPSRFQRASKMGKQRAVEKIHIDDDIETSVAKRKIIEVCHNRPYGKPLRARHLGEVV